MDFHFPALRGPTLMRKAKKSPKQQKKTVHWAESLENICYIPSRTSESAYGRNTELDSFLISAKRDIESTDSEKFRRELDLFLVEELLADLV